MSPMAMYLAAAFVLPRAPREREGAIDLRQYYYDNHAWYHALVTLAVATLFLSFIVTSAMMLR